MTNTERAETIGAELGTLCAESLRLTGEVLAAIRTGDNRARLDAQRQRQEVEERMVGLADALRSAPAVNIPAEIDLDTLLDPKAHRPDAPLGRDIRVSEWVEHGEDVVSRAEVEFEWDRPVGYWWRVADRYGTPAPDGPGYGYYTRQIYRRSHTHKRGVEHALTVARKHTTRPVAR